MAVHTVCTAISDKERCIYIDFFDSQQILRYLEQNGIINVPGLQQELHMKRKEKYLTDHPYEIWHGSNGSWYTYLPDNEKGRILKKRKSKESIETLIIDYYKELEPTIENIFMEWSNNKLEMKEIKKGTYDRYQRDFSRFFKKDDIEKMQMDAIDEEWLENFIKRTIVREKLTRKSFSNLRLLLFAIFKRAKKKKLTQIDIYSFVQNLELSKNIFEKKIFSKEEQVFSEEEVPAVIEKLMDKLDPVNLGLLLVFSTGIRVGELAALKRNDICGNQLHIQRTEICYISSVDEKTSKATYTYEIEDYPKSEAGDRYAVIPNDSMWIINKLNSINTHGEFLFMRNGDRIKTFTFRKRITSICNKLGIKPRSPHKIRKTYGTMLIDANVDESVIIDQMGHNDINCTRQYYFYSNKSNTTKTNQINKAAIKLIGA